MLQIRRFLQSCLNQQSGGMSHHSTRNNAPILVQVMDTLIEIQQLLEEINGLHIEGLPKIERLNALVGKYVNLEYRLPSGMRVKFLDDQTTYLGNQIESEFGGDRCFGILASMDFIMVCTYEKDGANPELVLYKKR